MGADRMPAVDPALWRIRVEDAPLASHCHPADQRVGHIVIGEFNAPLTWSHGPVQALRAYGPYATRERADRALAQFPYTEPTADDMWQFQRSTSTW